jgi:hypothetical protein
MGDIVLVGEHEIGIFAIEQGGNTLSQRSFRVVDVDYENARESAAQRLLTVSAGGHGMRLALSAIWIAFFALLGQARAGSTDSALSAAIDGAWRSLRTAHVTPLAIARIVDVLGPEARCDGC